jgi:16S rRNA (cytosine1402-N4)-methyltransferase
MTQIASTSTPGQTEHVPVFLNEVLTVFTEADGPVVAVFDGTFGRGGHARAVMQAYPDALMLAFDWDEEAIRFGEANFASEIDSDRLRLLRVSYLDFAKEQRRLSQEGARRWPNQYNLMLLDLGVSSPQLDRAERGFSFYHDGPLDMRMDQRGEVTAADIINTWNEQDLAKLFIEYGEVQRPFRVVRAIVHDRRERKPFATTRELASMIERVDGWQKKGSHPATRYFLALRMKVNEELVSIERVISDLIAGLADGGVLAIVTFHSLEDRVVKNVFKEQLPLGRLVNKKVIKPSDEEVARNPRARSAKLRAFKKIINPPSNHGEKR